jgi:DNA-binding transcriptional LysR family regulator
MVPPLLTALNTNHPKIRVVTVDATTTSLLPHLVSGRLDAAVVNLPVLDPDIEAEPLFEEEHVALVPNDHPLAGHDRLSLVELASVPLLLEPPGTGFRDDLDADAARAGVTLQPQAEIDGMRLLASLAYQGFGAAVLPASAIVEWTDNSWSVVPVDGTTPRLVGLAVPRRGRLSAPARLAVEVLRDVVIDEVPHRPGLRLVAGRG